MKKKAIESPKNIKKKTTSKKGTTNKKKTKKVDNKTKKINQLKKILFYALITIISIILIINVVDIFKWVIDTKKTNDLINSINESYTIKDQEDTKDVKLINSPKDKNNDYWNYIKMPFKSVDLTKLVKINKDTIAFIHLNNSNINYPIVQANDNKYYLTHAFDKKKNRNGWIFLDFRNNPDFTDDNTIIYGHGLKNTTMFGTLKNLLKKKNQNNKDNHVIYISTLTNDYLYQIFSIYTIKEESYYITPKFKTKEEKISWLDTMKKRNISSINTSVDEKDKILTLSTCQNNTGDRIVVHAKLIKMQKK